MSLSLLDWCIVSVYLLFAFGAGLVARKRIRGVADFLVAGRKMRLHLGIASLVGTELGLVTMMYFAEEGFRNGLAAFNIGVIWAAAYLIVGRTGFIVARIRRLRLLTVTEFFERRYDRGVRCLAALLLVSAGILGMGIFLKLGATFIVHFTGISENYLNLTMSVLVLVVVVYTVLGGMVSVVLTDFVQFLVLAVGMLCATGFVFGELGFVGLFARAETAYVDAGLNPFQHSEYGWAFLAFWGVFAIAGCTLWQPVAQRTLAIERPELNRKVFTTTSLMFLGRAFLPVVWGVGAALYLGADHDPTAAMPEFLAAILPIGIAGVLAAGMLAALMSTYDSYLLAWSGVIVQDLVGPLTPGGLSDKTRVLLTRAFVVAIGALMLVFGIWYQLEGAAFRYLLDACTIYYAGALAVVAAGLYWRRATVLGAYLGFVFGAVLPVGYIVEDLLAQGGVEEGTRFFRDVMPPNLRGFLSFALGGVGVAIGSLIPVGPRGDVECGETSRDGDATRDSGE